MDNECKELLRKLTRSSNMVSDSMTEDNYIPEFRYKEWENNIQEAIEYLRNQKPIQL